MCAKLTQKQTRTNTHKTQIEHGRKQTLVRFIASIVLFSVLIRLYAFASLSAALRFQAQARNGQ